MIRMRQGQKEVISFLGPPGSGKGTIAQSLQSQEDVTVLSTGVLCRHHVREKTPFGVEFSEHLAAGNLIPDQLISKMVREWLLAQKTQHLLLDGYPRTAPQVGQLVSIMREDMPDFNLRVVLFELSDDTVVARLSSRVMCVNTACQQVYSTAIEAPTQCAACGDALTRRADDEPEVIRKRLAIYAQHKDEMLAEYARYGIAIETFNVENVALADMFTQFSKLLGTQASV